MQFSVSQSCVHVRILKVSWEQGFMTDFMLCFLDWCFSDVIRSSMEANKWLPQLLGGAIYVESFCTVLFISYLFDVAYFSFLLVGPHLILAFAKSIARLYVDLDNSDFASSLAGVKCRFGRGIIHYFSILDVSCYESLVTESVLHVMLWIFG